MKHQLDGGLGGRVTRNILDFHAGLAKDWGSNTFENG